MKNVLNLSKLITFVVLFSLVLLVGVLGIYFDSFLTKKHFEETTTKMQHGFNRVHNNIKTSNADIKKGIEFIKTDNYLLSSIELINNYQDKDNYNAILLDEEKKNIVKQLLDRVKISMNNDIAVYDKNEDLIAFVIKEDKAYQLNFISYEDGEKVLYSRYEGENEFVKTPYHDHRLITFEHISYYDDKDVFQASKITRHFFNNELFFKSHLSILKEYASEVITHIEMTYVINDEYLKKVSNDLNMNISFSKDEKYAKNAINLIKTSSDDNLKISQTDGIYYSSAYIDTTDGKLYIVAELEKTLLLSTLAQSRYQLLLIMLVVTVFAMMILQYIFTRRLFQPLAQIVSQINKIENRDYTVSKLVRTDDELGLISKNINKLAIAINKRESELLESQSNLEYLSHHDVLTNTPNRRLFMNRLEHAIEHAKRNNTKLAVMFLDLDQFKQVNDTLGHDIGDLLLQVVAKRLSETIRSVDTLARIGGDEFNILTENISHIHDLEVILEKILADFKIPFICGEHEINTTASIGIAVFPDDGKNSTEIIKNADLAMYKSKEKGRNNYSFFSSELAENIEHRMVRINAMKSALVDFSEFSLVYQPKISIKTGKVSGIEALVRWNSSQLGFVGPDQFIPLAEDTNMIIHLGEWIAKKACSDFVKLQEEGYSIGHVSVNISSVQLQKSDLIKTIKGIIESTNINPKQLELEITESYIATNEEKAIKVLQQFRDMGIDLAVDDFGTGYSSMSYLQKLPVTRLKIDKSFVDNIPDSNESLAIVKAIIILAKTFSLSITAEGVENEAQAEYLKNKECDEIQGYLYSKPLSIDELKEYLEKLKGKTDVK